VHSLLNTNSPNYVKVYLVHDSIAEDGNCLHSLSIYMVHLLDCLGFFNQIVLINGFLVNPQKSVSIRGSINQSTMDHRSGSPICSYAIVYVNIITIRNRDSWIIARILFRLLLIV
jgi:hypothetical protein